MQASPPIALPQSFTPPAPEPIAAEPIAAEPVVAEPVVPRAPAAPVSRRDRRRTPTATAKAEPELPEAAPAAEPQTEPDPASEPELIQRPPEPTVRSRRGRRPVAQPVVAEQPPARPVAPAMPPASPDEEKPHRSRRARRDREALPAPAAPETNEEQVTSPVPSPVTDDIDIVIAELMEPEPEAEEPAAEPEQNAPTLELTSVPVEPVLVESVPAEPVPDAFVHPAPILTLATGSIPLDIELVRAARAVERESSEHIAEEIVAAAETPELVVAPHSLIPAVDHIDAVATQSETIRPFVPRSPDRVLRPLPPVALPASTASVAAPPNRIRQALKRGLAVSFVMAIATVFIASLSIPSFGSAITDDFASVQAPKNVSDGQSLSVGAGPALVASRDDYYAVGAPGSLYSTENTFVSKESQAIAVQLMAAVADGRLKGSVPDHIPEIQWLAQGVAQPDCGIDLRILQVILVALENFDTIGVSDINRKCTGQIEGGGTGSAHYVNGGGHAVDFYLMNGKSVPGSDANTLKFISILDPIMPAGSQIGQSECRAAAGISLQLQNLKEFPDTCTHMHVDVLGATGGLAIDPMKALTQEASAPPTQAPTPTTTPSP